LEVPTLGEKQGILSPHLPLVHLIDIKESLQSNLLKLRLHGSRRQPIEDEDFNKESWGAKPQNSSLIEG
jgi:hypothetical protein